MIFLLGAIRFGAIVVIIAGLCLVLYLLGILLFDMWQAGEL